MKIELLVAEVVNGSVFPAGAVVEDLDVKHAQGLVREGKAKSVTMSKKGKEDS